MTDLAYVLLTVVLFTTIAVVARRSADAGAPQRAAAPTTSPRTDGGDA